MVTTDKGDFFMEEQKKKEMEAKAEAFKKKLDMLSQNCAEGILDYLRDNQDKPDAEVKEQISKMIGAYAVISLMMTM